MKMLFFSLVLAITTSAAPLKNFPLVNEQGRPFQLHDLKGSYVLVTFIYTRCPLPTMCPLSMKLTRQVLSAWKKDPGLRGKRLTALAVTLDPEHDTPAALKAYGKRFSITAPDGILATGDTKVLAELAGEFNVVGFPDKKSVAHNSKHILLGPTLEPLKEFKDNEWKVPDVIETAKNVTP